ncbi:MAG: alpha/beta hydrolase [Deltaproteobacteria bacterium]|nr:alpha/beta hydrolase [Deltaproteobacteria bacterium]
MPLDPQAKAFLDQITAAGAPPLNALPVAEARQALRALFATGELEPVHKVEDRQIPGPDGNLPVRIYTPEGNGPLPVLVYFHGGGWVLGDLETHDSPCRALANAAGCMVIAADYRLAPEHKFPAAPEDCYAATKWVVLNAAAMGGDPTRIAVGGDSAGGNLAAAVALMAGDRGAPSLVYQLLVYPVTNYAFDTASYRENADGYLLTKEMMQWFWRHYLENETDGQNPYASPLRARDCRRVPPALVITAEFDPLRDEGETYTARLREAGVPAVTKRYNGMIHGFFSLGAVMDQGKQAIAEAAAGLRAAFAGVSPGQHK